MTDTELLDFLQELNDKAEYTGRCVLRISRYGRGWRLHETSRDDAVMDVRQAIREEATKCVGKHETRSRS